MSNVIRFLELMGGNSPMTCLSNADYAKAISILELTGTERNLLLARDEVGLSALLGGRANMQCMIMAPEEGARPLGFSASVT